MYQYQYCLFVFLTFIISIFVSIFCYSVIDLISIRLYNRLEDVHGIVKDSEVTGTSQDQLQDVLEP